MNRHCTFFHTKKNSGNCQHCSQLGDSNYLFTIETNKLSKIRKQATNQFCENIKSCYNQLRAKIYFSLECLAKTYRCWVLRQMILYRLFSRPSLVFEVSKTPYRCLYRGENQHKFFPQSGCSDNKFNK